MNEAGIPTWFTVTEFYAILATVWFALIVHLLVTFLKVKQGFNVKKTVSKVHVWWAERKRKKENKILGG